MVSTRFLNAVGLLIVCLSLAACEDSDVRLGREALEGGEPDKALNFFSIAAERDRTNADVRTLIGQVHLRKGNLREAAQWFSEAKRLGYAGATLGKSLSDEARLAAARDPQKALSLYAMVVQYDPAQAKPIAQVIASTADQMVTATPIMALQLYEAAVKYDAGIAPAVAKKISEAALVKLESDTGSALLMYRTAVKYDSSLAAAGSERISQSATAKLDSDPNSALRMMAVAVEYNPALKKGLGDMLAKSAIAALSADSSRAASLTKTAIDYDPGLAPSIANAAFERARNLGAGPTNWEEITRLARFAKPLKGADAAAWGKLLFENVSQVDTALVTSDELVSMGRVVAEFDNTKRSPLSELLVQVGAAAIAQETLDLESAEKLFNAAIGFDLGKKAAVSNVVWTHFSRRLLALPGQLTKEQFGRMFQMANDFGVPAPYASTVAPYAQALRQYTDGNRVQAINTFSQIAQRRPASTEGKAAIAMLAPPSPTIMKFNAQPFHFNTYSYGPGGGRGVDIQFISAEITPGSVSLTFSVKSRDHPDLLLFSRINRNGGPIGDNCELVYLLDDNGTKIYSTSGGFQGGRQASFNDCDQAINLNAGEEAIVTASFPMISQGATTVKFVSPDPDRAGHQSEWWVGNIQLKKGPFDAPPPPKLPEPASRGVPPTVQAPTLYLVANTTPPDAFVSLRTLPSLRLGERITTMPNGTALQVLERRSDGWWYVKVVETGQKGWALSGQSGKVWITCCVTPEKDTAQK